MIHNIRRLKILVIITFLIFKFNAFNFTNKTRICSGFSLKFVLNYRMNLGINSTKKLLYLLIFSLTLSMTAGPINSINGHPSLSDKCEWQTNSTKKLQICTKRKYLFCR